MQTDLTQDDSRSLFFNGIDGATGNYLTPSLSPRQVAKLAAGEAFTPEELAELRKKKFDQQPKLGLMEGVDNQVLAEAGWGVIFAPDISEDVKSKLSPLLDLRKEQAGKCFNDFPREKTYRAGDDKNAFLRRSGMGPGPAKPEKVPYYLLIVGSPESIPYRFQYQLDVQYAVGRICFDTAEQYGKYAEAVVSAEQGKIRRPRTAAFFGVRNPFDRATQLSSDHLVEPLRKSLAAAVTDWDWSNYYCKEDATKVNLFRMLGGAQTPALLFTASHGMGFPNGDQRQASDQGALLCQDWPGPLKHEGPIPEEFYMAGRHVPTNASVEGLIAFFFACYGAGTPRLDDFAHLVDGPQATISSRAFVGSLPKRLLAHPAGGALAVIGHVERAWTYSFMWDRAGEQLGVFEAALTALLNGKRVGYAMDYFNIRYAELSSDLTDELKERRFWKSGSESETLTEDEKLAGIWTANNDARSYIVLGDPAVCLAV